ncbi:alpha/beta hydrolase [Subsaximicrobium wynnwilliamsii]|uniref:Alpha/beta hydrolase n=1 Tax=Subsaximicrobium wynnwilliamsii TaxID=291179 RepID=A0A5C6ZLY9_9FLAO|nr:alpha/beta hydrolase [Subsaximicrobium wynnwilliamsii]TXD85276.1 alpha/beta hydrolase [Subsaximicrobium wynnwilliamsii]TXD91318.1 alpha/beta hydrolase [Subsaximicrobium wynnwilliamsii]TXE04712.1 alpha/beta hydrolase [Subsaximicrobium wynnwilliamsii]
MPFITNKTKDKAVDIFYEDYGSGQPVILIHGWPLSRKSWEQQVWKIVEAGYRCISYDRRGFGISSAPWDGYDYSSLTGDLNELIKQLDLKDAVLVGFSMGGGEVVRYFTDYGSDRIAKAALISSIIPLVKKKDDNPDGVPEEAFEDIKDALEQDRLGFLKNFGKGFYNYEKNRDRVSQGILDYDFSIASHASPRATIETAKAWMDTDFRTELKNVDKPTLIVHGDADETVPMQTSAKQAAKGIKNNQFEIIKGAPHGLNITHKDELNKILIDFLKK